MKHHIMEWDIDILKIESHPNNPRKQIGDISELSESIRANGIMQNLTVMPAECLKKEPEEQEGPEIPPNHDEWIVLIGHRRLAAAKEAGLKEVPCKIVWGLSLSEQIGIMMAENVQRNDLTIPEQIESFQLMLDLGETVTTVAEKTGFSESTIRRRTKNADVTKELTAAPFQLSFADLDELAKVDTEAKQSILKKARRPEEIKWRVDSEIAKQKREEGIKKVVAWLEEHGVKKYEGDDDHDWWECNYVGTMSTQGGVNFGEWEKRLGEQEGQTYYKAPNRFDLTISIRVERNAGRQQEDEKEDEKKRARRKEAGSELRRIERKIIDDICDFVKGMARGRYHCEIDTEKLIKISIRNDYSIDTCLIVAYSLGIENAYTVTEKDALQYLESHKPDTGLTILASIASDCGVGTIVDWSYRHNEEGSADAMVIIEMISKGGFVLDDEEQEVLEGTSSLYELAREEEDE